MKQLVFLLEEVSAREMLKGLAPRIVPETVTMRYIVFEGKQDLERNIGRRIRFWRAPNTAFIVLRDQDSGDCRLLKRRLISICREAGRGDTVVRIACQELESWYFGDLRAVEEGLKIGNLQRYGRSRKYRNADEIGSPARELDKITGGRYQKIDGSRAIGPLLSISTNRSRSFQVFVEGVRRAAGLG